MDRGVGNDRQRGGQSTPADGNRNRTRRRARNGEQETGTGTEQKGTNMEGMTRFCKVLSGGVIISGLPVDLEESELLEVLEELESIDIHVFDPSSSNAQRARSYIRYLAALWPDATLAELGDRIHSLLNNRSLSFADVMTMLRGERLSDRAQMADLRAVLAGVSLGNSQARTREVPLVVIQSIGKCLRQGISQRETARQVRCSIDTVRSIDKYLGLRNGYLNRMNDAATAAVREGVSIRGFAAHWGLTKGSAENFMNKARLVLVELGEL